jgi:hypothetical protein
MRDVTAKPDFGVRRAEFGALKVEVAAPRSLVENLTNAPEHRVDL